MTWPARLAGFGIAAALSAGAPTSSGAQSVPDDLKQERAEFARWLRDHPTSPFRAVGLFPLGTGLSLGPAAADVPLAGQGLVRIEERRGVPTLLVGGAPRPLGRARPVSLGTHQIMAAGPAGRTVIVAYDSAARDYHAPEYFGYAAAWKLTVALLPPAAPGTARILAPDGIEAEATEAGTVAVPVGKTTVPLKVRRIPAADGEESDLEIYFRDPTNGAGSYPAGRFVALVPTPDGRYLLDFNRARNPFCAYRASYPCPAPWAGNTLPVPVAAGEKYLGGGLKPTTK